VTFGLRLISGALALWILPFGSVLAAMPDACRDKKEVVVAAGEIPLFVVNEQRGIFVEMAKEAARRAEINIKMAVRPKKRAVAYFKGLRADALIPHPKGHPSASGYPSVPVLIKRNFAYVRKGEKPPQSIKELVGKAVGLTAQYYYSDALLKVPEIDFIRLAQADAINLSMLNRGRVEVAVLEEISGNEAIRKSGLTGEIIYDKENPISALEVVMLFQLTECGKALEEAFSRSFEAMEREGGTQAIKARYFRSVTQ